MIPNFLTPLLGEMMWSCKCFPHVSKMPTLIYPGKLSHNEANYSQKAVPLIHMNNGVIKVKYIQVLRLFSSLKDTGLLNLFIFKKLQHYCLKLITA